MKLDLSERETSNASAGLQDPGPEPERIRMSASADLEELGRRIRKLRIERRMTLKQVETASGLSATHLSEIERGRTSPTIGALIRIARSLGKRPSFFIETVELEEVVTVPTGAGPSWSPFRGVTAHALTPGIPGSELFTYRFDFEGEGAEWRIDPVGSGHAIYYVVRGDVEAFLGEDSVTLWAGDAIQGPLELPHRLRLVGTETAEVLAVLTSSLAPAESSPS